MSITQPSFMKFCPVVPEICHGQVHGPAERKEKKNNTNKNKNNNKKRSKNLIKYELHF